MPARVLFYGGIVECNFVSCLQIPLRNHRHFAFDTRRGITRVVDEFIWRTRIEPRIFPDANPIGMGRSVSPVPAYSYVLAEFTPQDADDSSFFGRFHNKKTLAVYFAPKYGYFLHRRQIIGCERIQCHKPTLMAMDPWMIMFMKG